jgi:hypothetical protein
MLEEWNDGIMNRNTFFPQLNGTKNPIFQYSTFPLFQNVD